MLMLHVVPIATRSECPKRALGRYLNKPLIPKFSVPTSTPQFQQLLILPTSSRETNNRNRKLAALFHSPYALLHVTILGATLGYQGALASPLLLLC